MSDIDPLPKAGTKLCGYEKVRAQNIERNNAKLRALGLISALEERTSNANAWGTSCGTEKDEETPADSHGKKRKRPSSATVPKEGSRKSLRIRGVGVDLKPIQLPRGEDEVLKERKARVKECREMRIRAANAVAVEGAEAAAKENPTATYGHCLMRVTTMSDKRLANRVKVIERAAGRHCVVKMAIFKSCLQDEGMWELADLASEALERLKALQAPPV
mmetsp:Transcript_33183/g.39747  ORF Transcript_33183/g.39747 Transcript_33183/m.39747 type:complete len:218 (+) Transcript_33183:73-726(+)|eukprot:CAMPEP_0198268376 /NCGR_PEP_ID=MMETSP1447-20131203/36965_1 /TAXON_ID=420782 /ORGANISM="Chaetoceros dichaeta, Strain CCMP1751" /LENGTH=217 /DNA_ID=CAMNT_0043959395 /DNA_START=24 /DNA_END=677 /DNA_ORIENTATION=-